MRLMTLKLSSMGNRNYLKNSVEIRLQRAIERCIEIIGEAMNRILKENKDLAITNARKIVDARNYIIHGYDSLSVDILWSIVVNHLPHLKSEVKKLLQE